MSEVIFFHFDQDFRKKSHIPKEWIDRCLNDHHTVDDFRRPWEELNYVTNPLSSTEP